MRTGAGAMLILYGLPHSLYTGKVRAYLRKRGLAYVERSPAHPDFRAEVVPRIGRAIIPVLQLPDGAYVQTLSTIWIATRRGRGLCRRLRCSASSRLWSSSTPSRA